MKLELDKIIGMIEGGRGKSAATTPGGRINRTASQPQGYGYDGDEYVPVGLDGILAASDKLLAVNRGESSVDNRDSLAFKRIYTPDKMMRERIKIDADKSGRKLMRALSKKRNLQGMAPFHFDNYATGLLIGNPLSSPLEEINPMHIIEQARRVTLMGPGGIGSSQAITQGMQSVDSSQFGFMSPIEGPECHTGDGEVYTKRGWVPWTEVRSDDVFAGRKDGKVEWVEAERLIAEPYSGKMYLVEKGGFRMCVTPNHRVEYLLKPDGEPQMDRAEYLDGKTILIPTPSYREHHEILREEWKTIQYDGTVYCATVPGGILLVRGSRDGKAYWSGNSERAGVDTRLSTGTRIGSDGRIYQLFRNRRTGKMEWVSPDRLLGKTVKLPE